MRIADHLTLYSRPSFLDPSEADDQALRECFILTRETGEICARILRRLACYAEPQPGGFFFTGERGVGKTHLLRYLAGFLADPKNPGWEALHPYLGNDSIPRVSLNSLFIKIPSDPSVDLGLHLESKLATGTPHAPVDSDPMKRQLPGDEFAASMHRVAAEHAARSLGILVLDDISRRLDRSSDSPALEREFQLLKILMRSFSERGVLVLMVMDEGHLKWERAMGIQMSILDSLGDSCDFIWLSRKHIVEIIDTALTSKSDVQKLEIRGVLNGLRRKLPQLATKAETFIDLYPIHPEVFYTLFQLRALLPQFSPLRFAQTALWDVHKRSAAHLVTLDYLFDYVQNDLRRLDPYRALMEGYDHMLREVIPLLKPAIQSKARLLLKGMTFLTLCESQPSTVRTLANQLLIYDESDLLHGYGLTSAILLELEQTGAKFLWVEGEKLERRYRLLDAAGDANLQTAKELLAQDDEFPQYFPVLAYEWLHSEVATWFPDTNDKSVRKSQSLAVPIPGKEEGPRGLVYLKSVFDPLWSREDLVALEESSYPWVLLVLSPYERFYEYEQSLQELAANLSRLLIWHPDIPTADENDRLHKLVALWHALDSVKREMMSPQERLAWTESRTQANEILRSLYVYRGRLNGATIQRRIGDDIKDQSLPEYLSGELSLLENAFFAGVPGSVKSGGEVTPLSLEIEQQTLHWANLLAGKAAQPAAGGEDVKQRIVEWWSHLKSSGLSTGLQQIPDAFLTVQFWDYVKAYEFYVEALRPLLVRLRDQEIDISEAMVHVAHVFNNEGERLLIWKQSLDNLSGLVRWLPSFEHQRNYLYSAVPTAEESVEDIRNQLLGMLDKPQQFLEAISRDTFEQGFLRFKKGYIDYYVAMHEDALHIIGNPEKMESKVDYIALRNLEMLSNLQYAEKSYLNRARIIGKWVQANQCDYPVRDILESLPRCYCNFSPAASAHLRESVSQVNEIIQEGIAYFRAVLRSCKMLVIQELRTMQVDDFHSRQIAALLSNGRMIPLESPTVDILNRIIERHPKNFQAGMRTYHAPPPSTTR